MFTRMGPAAPTDPRFAQKRGHLNTQGRQKCPGTAKPWSRHSAGTSCTLEPLLLGPFGNGLDRLQAPPPLQGTSIRGAGVHRSAKPRSPIGDRRPSCFRGSPGFWQASPLSRHRPGGSFQRTAATTMPSTIPAIPTSSAPARPAPQADAATKAARPDSVIVRESRSRRIGIWVPRSKRERPGKQGGSESLETR